MKHTPGRGLKIRNEYAEAFGRLYAKTPKAVFAAVAFSLAFIDVEEQGADEAVQHFINEWRCLHENGIVKQQPPQKHGSSRLLTGRGGE